MFPHVTYEAKFLQRENRFGFSREERSEQGGLNRLRFLCAYVVKHGSMAKVALAYRLGERDWVCVIAPNPT